MRSSSAFFARLASTGTMSRARWSKTSGLMGVAAALFLAVLGTVDLLANGARQDCAVAQFAWCAFSQKPRKQASSESTSRDARVISLHVDTAAARAQNADSRRMRSEEHTSELKSLMRLSY